MPAPEPPLGIGTGEEGGTNVYLSNRGQMVMPVELSLTYEDGSTGTVRLPVEMWNQGPRFTYGAPAGRRIVGVEVDPHEAAAGGCITVEQ